MREKEWAEYTSGGFTVSCCGLSREGIVFRFFLFWLDAHLNFNIFSIKTFTKAPHFTDASRNLKGISDFAVFGLFELSSSTYHPLGNQHMTENNYGWKYNSRKNLVVAKARGKFQRRHPNNVFDNFLNDEYCAVCFIIRLSNSFYQASILLNAIYLYFSKKIFFSKIARSMRKDALF